MGLFDIDDFQEKLNQEGQKYFDSVYDDFVRRQDEADAMIERTNRQLEKKHKELAKLRKAEHIARSREKKKRIFGNLEVILFSNYKGTEIDYMTFEDYMLECMTSIYKNTIPQGIGVRDSEGKQAIEIALKGYAKSLKEFERSETVDRFWAEIFYLISEGIHFNTDNIEYIHNILQKEIGEINSPGYEEVETCENFLKRCYTQFKNQPYWGYNFEKDPIDNQVQRRIDYFSENIILDDNEIFDVIPGLESYIRKHTILLDEEKSTEVNKTRAANEKQSKKKSEKDDISRNAAKDIFPELKEHFKEEDELDESIEPNGFFDFTTKSRNKKIEKLQDKRTGLREDIDDNKEELYSFLKSNVEVIRKLISKEKMLSELEEKKSSGKISRSDYKDKKDDIKEDISDFKDEIKDNNKEIKNEFSHLLSNIEAYNKVNSELYFLTNNEHYNEVFQISGTGINIAQAISKNERITDSNILSDLFSSVL